MYVLQVSMEPVSTLEGQSLDAYAAVSKPEQIGRVRAGATTLTDRSARVLHVNATATGGGVAELLHSIVPTCRRLDLEVEWQVLTADPAFFEITKTLHNGLQGASVKVTESMLETYRETVTQNASACPDGYDVIVLHDPQPLGMAAQLAARFRETTLIWRCHIDLTDPDPATLAFVNQHLDAVDYVVCSRDAYGDVLEHPAVSVIWPAIDPLSEKNRSLTAEEYREQRQALEQQGLDLDRPFVAHVSRFDPWKDQEGTIAAFRRISQAHPDVQLALVGGSADDDPEGQEMFQRIEATADGRNGIVLCRDLTDLGVNHIQREAAVVVQKSIQEGFGLVVSEALWKETPVIGSTAGGIPLQIEETKNGYLVAPTDVDGLADRTIDVLEDEHLRSKLGKQGRETVRDHFLLPRLLAEWFELFETVLEENTAERADR